MKHFFCDLRSVVTVTDLRGARRIGSGASLGLLLLSLSAAGQNYRLSDPLPANRAVTSFEITPDGHRAVYVADAAVEPFDELFSVTTNGAHAPVTLSATPATGTIEAFRIGPDGQRVAFVGDIEEAGVLHLYAVPVDGSAAPVRLDGSLVSGGDVSRLQFQFTPDASRVIYLADAVLDERFELHSVPADGSSPPILLGGPLVAGGDVLGRFAVSLDGSRVVYVADQDANDVFELYSVPADGSAAPVKLSGTMVFGGDVSFGPLIGPDGGRVLFLADQDVNGVDELFSAPVDGSAPAVRLNAALVSGGDVQAKLAFGPDGSRAYYVADQTTNDVFELYSVPADGSAAPLTLSGALVSGGDVVLGPIVSSDGGRVVYLADGDTNETFELYSALADGSGAPVKLNAPLVAGGDVAIEDTPQGGLFVLPRVTPDGTRVVYFADQEVPQLNELFSVPIDGSQAPVKLNNPVTEGVTGDSEIDPAGRRIFFLVKQGFGRDLYAARVDGAQPAIRVNGSPRHTPTDSVNRFRPTPDGRSALYLSAGEHPLELYATRIDVRLLPTKQP